MTRRCREVRRDQSDSDSNSDCEVNRDSACHLLRYLALRVLVAVPARLRTLPPAVGQPQRLLSGQRLPFSGIGAPHLPAAARPQVRRALTPREYTHVLARA